MKDRIDEFYKIWQRAFVEFVYELIHYLTIDSYLHRISLRFQLITGITLHFVNHRFCLFHQMICIKVIIIIRIKLALNHIKYFGMEFTSVCILN